MTLVVVGLLYFVVLPEIIATQYMGQVHRIGSSLRADYMQLENSTDQALIEDPTTTPTSIVPAVDQLRSLLRESRISVDRFSSVAGEYHPLPYTGFTTQAKAAHALQIKSLAFTQQSDEAFNKYEELINFIQNYDSAAAVIEHYVDDFNAAPDLNVYQGQAQRFYGIAAQVRTTIQSLDKAPTPHEAVAFKAASVQTFSQVAAGFDAVALGLQIPADDVIYGGARQIEAVDATINGPNQEVYTRDISASRTIKSIQELREKLELILP